MVKARIIGYLLLVYTGYVGSVVPSKVPIRMVLTAALVDNGYYEFRKKQYITSLKILASYAPRYPFLEDLYVIEAISKQGPTFLEDYTPHVFYATTNNPRLRNHGINEAKTLLEGIDYFKFGPDDMILKMTGRYEFLSDYFIGIVSNNADDYDAIVTANPDGYILTLGMAMKCRHLQEMYLSFDYTVLERHHIPIEHFVTNYIRQKENDGVLKVLYVDRLHMRSNILGSTTAPGIGEVISYH